MNQFISELNRRNVTRVALLYAGLSWLLIQIAETVLPIFAMPTDVLRPVILLLVVGFVVAVIVSWFYDVTPDGVKRDDKQSPATPKPAMNLAIGVVLAVAGLAFVADRAGLWSDPNNQEPASAVVAAGSEPADLGAAASLVRGVAVLPFENLSEAAENAFFATGVHDEILTNLATVRGFRVISRTSMRGYAGTRLRMPEIARQLGVSHVMEGSVRRSKDQVRVTVLLVDALKDQPIWSKSYDRTLTDIFDIQSEIARNIVTTIQGELSPEDYVGIGKRSTSDTVAYDLFLKARAVHQSNVRSSTILEQPLALIRQALAVDPQFLEAWVELVRICGGMVWWDEIEYTSCAEDALVQVTLLAPESPQLALAKGIFAYRVKRDFAGALSILQPLVSDLPNNVTLWEFIGFSARRVGRWDVSLEAMRKSMLLSPRDESTHGDFLITLAASGDWEAAIRFGNDASVKFPDNALLPFMVADFKRKYQGDLSNYAALMLELPAELRPTQGNIWFDNVFANQKARLQWVTESVDSGVGLPFWITGVEGTFHRLNGRPDEARVLAQNAYRQMQRMLGDNWQQEGPFILALVAMNAANAGEREVASVALARFQALLELSPNQLMEWARVFVLFAYAELGDMDRAWQEAQEIIALPLGLTVWDFRMDQLLQYYFSDHPSYIEWEGAAAL